MNVMLIQAISGNHFSDTLFVAAIDTLRFLTTSDGNNYVRSYFGLEALKVLNISENIIDRSQDTLAQIVIRPNKKFNVQL